MEGGKKRVKVARKQAKAILGHSSKASLAPPNDAEQKCELTFPHDLVTPSYITRYIICNACTGFLVFQGLQRQLKKAIFEKCIQFFLQTSSNRAIHTQNSTMFDNQLKP